MGYPILFLWHICWLLYVFCTQILEEILSMHQFNNIIVAHKSHSKSSAGVMVWSNLHYRASSKGHRYVYWEACKPLDNDLGCYHWHHLVTEHSKLFFPRIGHLVTVNKHRSPLTATVGDTSKTALPLFPQWGHVKTPRLHWEDKLTPDNQTRIRWHPAGFNSSGRALIFLASKEFCLARDPSMRLH